MIKYKYQAVDSSGRMIKGDILAESKEQAIQKIKSEMKLLPVEIIEESYKVKKGRGGSKKNFILYFTQQLANLLNSGVQIDDALTVLTQLTSDPQLCGLIEGIQEEIQGGADFSQALTKYPSYFNESYINMVRAGESGGFLGLCLERLAQYIEQDKKFKNTIKSSLLYPIIVMVMGVIAVIVLFLFVVPRFVGIFDTLGQELPLPTRILLLLSNGLIHYWYYIFGGPLIIILVYYYYRSTPEGKYQTDLWKNHLPFLGQLRIKLAVSRFTRILGTMLQSGVPLLKGIQIARNTLDNEVIKRILDKLYEHVRKGGTLSTYLQNEGTFPELAVFLIGVGERTGNLEKMLKNIADNMAADIEASLKNFLTVFEPFVTLLLGLFVLFIVLSILLPIFAINQFSF